MERRNEVSKSQIMHKEYKNAVDEGNEQQKEFEAERDELKEKEKTKKKMQKKEIWRL